MNTYESILSLRSPKLLVLRHFGDNTDSLSIAHPGDPMSYLSFVSRDAKKEKSGYEAPDFLEAKQGKARQRKKKKVKGSFYRSEELPGIEDKIDLNEMQASDILRSSDSIKNEKFPANTLSSEQNYTDSRSLTNDIYIDDLITVQDLASKLRIHSSDIIKWLFLQGISVTINQLLDISVSTLVAHYYSFNILQSPSRQDTGANIHVIEQAGRLRAPIIALLGHVDHGKTTLMKAIGKSNVFLKEAGDITQSISSYEVLISQDSLDEKLIFLDTPGHEAFAGMRQRSISIADLAILVISATDGLQPQTYEAISYIQEKNIPFIVALNKIDKQEANILKTRKQLSDAGIEDNSSDNSVIIEVSALSYTNIDLLLSTLLRLSKVQDLKSDPSVKAEGVILEAYLSKKKGSMAQLLVRNGTLFVGDVVLAGSSYGKVKAIINNAGQKIQSIESVALAEILCFNEVPNAGLSFQVVDNEKIAKTLSLDYGIKLSNVSSLNSRISLDDSSQNCTKAIGKQANFIIKTATQGTIEPILQALSGLSQAKVQINLLLVASGEVSLKDIELASASQSAILAFGLNNVSRIIHAAEKKNITIRAFSVIYDLLSYVESYMLQFVDLDYEKQMLGSAKVRDIFAVKRGIVAGCFVLTGKLKRKSYFQVKRGDRYIYTGLIDSLKKVKEDIDEVLEGNECGIMCNEYSLWENGDVLECYILKPLKKVL